MKNKSIPFNAEKLLKSVEEIRAHVSVKRKLRLRTTKLKLPKSAPAASDRQKTGQELEDLAEKMVDESDPVKAERLKVEIISGFYGET